MGKLNAKGQEERTLRQRSLREEPQSSQSHDQEISN